MRAIHFFVHFFASGENKLKAKVGEKIRLFVGNGGPNLVSSFVEFHIDVPATYLLVDHSIFRTFDKGTLGRLEATGPENPSIFKPIPSAP